MLTHSLPPSLRPLRSTPLHSAPLRSTLLIPSPPWLTSRTFSESDIGEGYYKSSKQAHHAVLPLPSAGCFHSLGANFALLRSC